ncbi:MAG: hypothetical protein M3Y72_09660 [Acidobacteriota bacterium]|nr:hypothetical protein [Acidobacteriota bacterium]
MTSISREASLRLGGALAFFPELRSRLQAAAAVSAEMGALSVSRSFRQVSRENLVLVGD